MGKGPLRIAGASEAARKANKAVLAIRPGKGGQHKACGRQGLKGLCQRLAAQVGSDRAHGKDLACALLEGACEKLVQVSHPCHIAKAPEGCGVALKGKRGALGTVSVT